MRTVYLDYAATTPVSKEVFDFIKPFLVRKFGNASEFHALGREAKEAVFASRVKVANFIGAKPTEIVFTSCATESINMAHKGLIEAVMGDYNKGNKPHIITSSIEHKSVLETCKHLEKMGFANITYLPVDKKGLINIKDLKHAICKETILVSIMYVNSEIGTIQPIMEIGKYIKGLKQKIYFHSDVTQAVQYLNCNVNKLGVDMMSFTGHKFYAPKGIGVLYIRGDTPLIKQQDGGGQESDFRAGTENTAYIVGLGKAIEILARSRSESVVRIKKLQKKLIASILKIPGVVLTGHSVKRAPHIASFLVKGVEGEAMVLYLSNKGIMVSSGSACASDKLLPSHVLTAMGIPPELSHGSIRISLGKETTWKDVDYVIKILPEIIQKLRVMAPSI
jgi:cysteine desulfurase